MLLVLFTILMAISLFLIGLSYYSKEAIYSLAGFFLLFSVCILVLIPGTLELQNGSTIQVNYTYVNSSVTGSTVSIVPVYTNFNATNSRSFGVWLLILSIIGIAITLYEIKSGREQL